DCECRGIHLEQPIGFAFDAVREILSKQGTAWNSEYGFLRIRFTKPDDFVSREQTPATLRANCWTSLASHDLSSLQSICCIGPELPRRVRYTVGLDVAVFWTDLEVRPT